MSRSNDPVRLSVARRHRIMTPEAAAEYYRLQYFFPASHAYNLIPLGIQ